MFVVMSGGGFRGGGFRGGSGCIRWNRRTSQGCTCCKREQDIANQLHLREPLSGLQPPNRAGDPRVMNNLFFRRNGSEKALFATER
jgi:hypothetical protein